MVATSRTKKAKREKLILAKFTKKGKKCLPLRDLKKRFWFQDSEGRFLNEIQSTRTYIKPPLHETHRLRIPKKGKKPF